MHMRAVIVADQDGSGLAPLTDARPAALLPIAGKSMLARCIEWFVDSGVRDIWVAASVGVDAIYEEVGDGSRWGARIRYLYTRADGSLLDIERKLENEAVSRTLIVACDRLFQFKAAAALQAAAEVRAFRGEFGCGWQESGMAFLDSSLPRTVEEPARVEIPDGDVMIVNDLRTFWRANMQAVSGRFPVPMRGGRELVKGAAAGYGAYCGPDAIRGEGVFIDEEAHVESGAEVGPETVVGKRSMIRQGTVISRTVVLDDTFIGENLDLDRKIVAGNRVIDLKTGAVVEIPEAAWIHEIENRSIQSGVRGAIERAAAAAALLIAAPAAAFDWIRHRLLGSVSPRLWSVPGNDGRFVQLCDYGGEASSLEFWLNARAVLRGSLRWVGVYPRSPQWAGGFDAEWQRVLEREPFGVWGPGRALLDAGDGVAAVVLADLEFSNDRRRFRGLRWGLSKIFSKGRIFAFGRTG
jgi:NDP-sugar pyrophosphorylase family protein